MVARRNGVEPSSPAFSLVFPTFNPGYRVDKIWSEVEQFLNAAPEEWETLFVCDGCTDGTPERLQALTASSVKPVRILSYAPNQGKGYALRHGLAAAKGQWRIFTDVDLAYGFDDLRRVAGALRAGADVAIASRVHPDSCVLVSSRLQTYAYRRYVQSKVFSVITRMILPLSQRDTQAGLKGLSAAAADRLLPLLCCNGFEFDCELLTACAQLNLHVREVPVCVRYLDGATTTGLHTVASMVRSLWTIRRRWQGPVRPATATLAQADNQTRHAA